MILKLRPCVAWIGAIRGCFFAKFTKIFTNTISCYFIIYIFMTQTYCRKISTNKMLQKNSFSNEKYCAKIKLIQIIVIKLLI